MKREFRYFFYYRHTSGFGMLEIIRNKKIKNYDDIISIKELIEKEIGIAEVAIVNWKKL